MRHFETALNIIFSTMAILGAFLLTLAVAALLGGCGPGGSAVRHEGQSRHDVVISLNLFGECDKVVSAEKRQKCYSTVTDLLAVLAEAQNGKP